MFRGCDVWRHSEGYSMMFGWCPEDCPALFNWLLNAFRRVSLRCSKPFRGYSTLFEDIRRRWCSIDSVECLSNSLGKHRALFTVQGTRQVGSLIVVPTRSRLKDLLASSHPVERVDLLDLPIGALNSLYSSICYLIFWLILIDSPIWCLVCILICSLICLVCTLIYLRSTCLLSS